MSIAIKRNFTIPSTSAIGASELYITSGAGSTSTGTGALQVAGGAGISGVLSLGGDLNLFNGAFYTGLRSSATASTTYTLPANSPSTGSSVLSSDAAGNLSWVLMSASGSGLTLNGLTSSTQYFATSISGSGFTSSSIGSTHTFYIGLAGNASTGLVSSTTQTFFGFKTFASGAAITSATASTSTSTGSLTITGGVGIGGSLWTSSTSYSSISGVGISNGVVTGNLTGTATSAAQVNLDASTATRYLIGTLVNTASGSTQLSTGSGITIGNNIITATTFAGNATSSTSSGSAGKWISSRTVTFATGDVTGSFSLDGSTDVNNIALTIGANAVALGTDTTGNYVGTVATSGNGISIIGSAGEGTTFTIDSNATSSNTVSTIVFRDSSGNFSAGTITGSLTGTASIATSAANLNTATDTSNTLYLIGSRSSTGIASTQLYVDTNISFSGSTITATTFSGTATSALNAGTLNITLDTANTIYLTGSRSNTSIGATASYVLSGVSALGNTITATTFSGTATSSTNAANTNITLDTTSTIYLTGSRSNASIGSTPVYVLSGVSALGNTLTATTFSGNATTATNSGAAGKWSTSRTVTFATGDITGSFSLDGSADVSNVALTIAANSVALGTDTTGNYAGSISTSGSGISVIGTAGEGTAFTIDSNATSSNTVSTVVFRDGSGNFSAGTITAALTGTASIASSAAAVNTATDTSSTLYLIGSRSSTGIASTQIYVDTNISFSGSTITATTFSGTASSALNSGTANIVSDTTNTIYLTGSRSNASIGSTPVYVLSGVSALGNTITATTFSGTATSAALVNVAASTATRYLAAVSLNTATGSTQIFTGSGITIGDNRLTVGGLAVTSGTASTSTTTGALTVNGGVGITGQLSLNTIAIGSTGVSVTPSIVFTGTAGTVITMSVLSDTTLAWEGSSGQLFSIDNNLSSGEIFSVSDISGLPLISASAGQTVTLNEFGGFTQVGNGLASTSTTSGALRVIGGIGVTGNAYVGGVINANAGTNSTSISTGAVVINGGLGITGSAYIGGTFNVNAGTNSTSITTGSVVVNGGLGVTGNAYVGGVFNSNAGTNSTSNTTGSVVINGGLGVTGSANIGGTINANNGTNSTSTITGALIVSGGIGATGNIYVGGAVNVNNGTNSTSTTTGAVIINGGLGVTGNANIGGTVRITNTTAATGVSTGAFTVAGGVGIGQSLFVNGNTTLNGQIFVGTNTFSKNLGTGDMGFDNGSTDTPASLYYWANNRNFGTDVYFSGSGTTRYRIVKELNESGGAELWSIDRDGIVYRTAYAVGETINTRMYNYSDLGMAATTTISSTSYTTFATITYTPKSSTSYLWIEFSCTYTVAGAAADDFWSNIEVAGTEQVNSNQVWTNGAGGGTRSGVLFPLACRYTNTGTAGIAISVRSKRGTSDDNATIYGNSSSGYMRIQEIGR